MKLRRKLLRVATLLKACMLAYREVVYVMDLTDLRSKDEVYRYIEVNHTGTKCLHRVHAPFSTTLTPKPEHAEVALLFNQGTAAMHLFSRLTKKLFEGLDVTPTVAEIEMEKPKIPVKTGGGPIPKYFPHTVMVVRIDLTTEFWILDPTGAQYGIQDVFVPWKHYVEEYEVSLTKEYPFPVTETQDLDYFATLPGATTFAAKIAKERQARIVFSSFVDCLVIENLLGVSETDFTRWVGEFQERLKEHLNRNFDYGEAAE
ncbi:uncharacterized protein N7484_003303 [Penicillium longicatenatum]|uniref:uncharacterized protein n=1 Tax=Penicillium longicatenatum TaxID=1561947 RepID=UPI002548EFCD|nr:uncharacterized protein N7484_003303 [Penicillium longicatenatum]KAJ5649580.1 hypothetical protein N7484_003303 [Penicillium longicatenatum]